MFASQEGLEIYRVIHDTVPGADGWMAAEVHWEGEPRLAIQERGADDPDAWFIVPKELEHAIREGINDLFDQL